MFILRLSQLGSKPRANHSVSDFSLTYALTTVKFNDFFRWVAIRDITDGLWLIQDLHKIRYSVHHSVSQKYPPGFSDIFSQTVGNFLIKFCTFITRSHLHWTTNFCPIICNFDEARPPSSQHMFKISTIGRNACWHFPHSNIFPSWNFWSKFYSPIIRSYLR